MAMTDAAQTMGEMEQALIDDGWKPEAMSGMFRKARAQDARMAALVAALKMRGEADSLGRWHERRCAGFGSPRDDDWCGASCIAAREALKVKP